MKRFSTPDWLFFALLAFLSLVFLRLISYFILDIFLAIIFTQLFHGVLHFSCTKLKMNRSLASLFLSIWDQFGRHYKEELDGWNSGKRGETSANQLG